MTKQDKQKTNDMTVDLKAKMQTLKCKWTKNESKGRECQTGPKIKIKNNYMLYI